MDPKDWALATLLQSTDQDTEDYKRWLRMPSHMALNPTYSASNVTEWIKLDKFHDYLPKKKQDARPDASNEARDIIEISDGGDATSPPISFHLSMVPDQKPVFHDIINLCSDSDDPDDVPSSVKVEIKTEPTLISWPPGRARKALDEICITRSEKVTQIIELTEVPDRFPIYEQDTAFILDFSHDDRAKKETKTGKPKGLDAFLKSEDQDPWGKGTNGSTSRDTKLKILGDIPSRYSTHQCNGGNICEFFDPALLRNYERTDAVDMTLTREIFSRELLQNQTDTGSAAGFFASFRGINAAAVRNPALTTQAVLGISLAVKHPAFGDTRRLRDEVSNLKSDRSPGRLLWAGILADYEKDQKLPMRDRYVHHIRMEGAMKIAVTMNPELTG
ncbi:hypothetical protein B0H13DRAFT_2478429 [Mycena leptocephala]|nr:hypothetical protein B0H13DRAFT_2478429 [Mycena leptocephala]